MTYYKQPLRLESQRFRLLSIVVGCFVFCLVFLLSSRPDATAFDTVSPRASLEGARRPAAVKTLRTSSSAGFGGDFHVDILPQQQGQSVEQSAGDKMATEWVRDAVIVEERSDAEASEAATEPEEAERDSDGNAAAASSNPDDQPAPGAKEKEVRDADAVVTTAAAAATTATAQPAAETTTATEHDRPEEKARAAGGGQSKLQEQPVRQRQEERHEPARSGGGVHQQQQPLCDFSDFRSDICDMAGDIRLDANASAFVVVDPASGAGSGQWHRVRPYPRKGDGTCMGRITEVTVRSTGDAPGAPRCTAAHAAPAVVFSIGGYTGNIFHDFSDVLVPLYNTAQRYRGDVQLVMANVASWWLVKYDRLLRELSRHAPLDLAKAGAAREVHCFPRAVVSLRAHKELIIERERSADGLATPDFTRFVRRALSLPRDAPTRLGDGTGRKPRLLIISRHRTRLLLNLDAVVRAAEEVGFEAVVNESDVGNDISQVGALINSCDALVGVHGAGLTNMMFLPPGATLVQIVPWGGLQWMARADYGDPAEAMGLRYIQYEVAVGESTLKDKFPSGHKIFTDPTSLHKKGFMFIRQTLMDGQDIAVDVGRFREVLLQVLNNLSQ
ncbi:uncharacterized protein C2845_PM07G02220 [Panicum miliaceum]|uniref:Glycosyltransferase 61 catalytic domain-containing protein n=1 Tax=Panicum miliaceum TaxID=4540 RepID=A0A3L6SIT2_PANMI|nr:uncharacterized protein C2845_PM07G02220 [Panicum miliaceum]